MPEQSQGEEGMRPQLTPSNAEAGPSTARPPPANSGQGRKRKRQRSKKKQIDGPPVPKGEAGGVIDLTGGEFEDEDAEVPGMELVYYRRDPVTRQIIVISPPSPIKQSPSPVVLPEALINQPQSHIDQSPSLEAGPSRYSPSRPTEQVRAGSPLQSKAAQGAFQAPRLSDEAETAMPNSPSGKALSPQKGASEAVAIPQSAEHFQPPALFNATVEPPSIDDPTVSASVAERTKAMSAVPETSTHGLLLPSHVTIDDSPAEVADEPEDGPHHGDQSMEGVHFIDDDMMKGVTRYFDPSAEEGDTDSFLANADQARICQNCKRPGHKARECPHIICMTCGQMDDHERRDCPMGLTCFACGKKGHRRADCTDPLSKSAQRNGCDLCGSGMHMSASCPTIWRVYTYRSSRDRDRALVVKAEMTGWEKEAGGGVMDELWCYNCAREGHLGDDCPQRRGSLARLNHSSAFSQSQASRGPFADTRYRPPIHVGFDTPRGTHTRFDDDALSDLTPDFAGSAAGKRGREKIKRRMMEQDRQGGRNRDDEEVSLLDRIRPGSRSNTRPWDSDRRSPSRRSNGLPNRPQLPFGHSHLMHNAPSSVPSRGQRGKGIQFGKLSSLPPRPGPGITDSPSMSRDNGRPPRAMSIKGAGSQALLDRALGDTRRAQTSPLASPIASRAGSPKRSRRHNATAEDMDYEAEWRRSGLSGGNVSKWGAELDREERQVRADGRREVPAQRYHGGYD